MRKKLLVLVTLFIFALFLRELYGIGFHPLFPSALFTLLSGFAILAAFFAGQIFSGFSFPTIVGYLFVGILFGPGVMHIFSHGDIKNLEFITQLALGLITISAGRELSITSIRSNLVLISRTIFIHLLFIPAVLGILIYFYFTTGILVAILAGLILTTSSPAVPMALISEYEVEGRFPVLVLSILIMRDILIIFLFASIGSIVTGGGWNSILWIVASLLLGFFSGWLYSSLLKFMGRYSFVFLLFFLLVIYEISIVLPFNYIVETVFFGFSVENLSKKGDDLLEVIEKGSLPLYTIFFSLAGASLEIDVILKIGSIAALIVIIRVVLLFVATYFAFRNETLKYYLFTGFVPQAGVSIGMAVIFEKMFPQFGLIAGLVVASAVINEILGPFFFKWGVSKALSENISNM